MKYLNKDITSTFMNKIIKILSGPIILLFIPMFLTSEEQGYWYTFTSIAALSVFADLGFSTIVLQFSAHEFAFCSFNKHREIEGDNYHIWKLASFFRFSIKWLLKVIFIVFPIIIIGGYFFLYQKYDCFFWQWPWLLYSFASSLFFLNSSIISFFEGCDSVAIAQKCRMYITLANALTVLIGLYSKIGLYALSFSLLMSVLVGGYFIYKYFGKTAWFLWNYAKEECYSWNCEFNSLIWRYAISWCSSYFIFQLFTPLAFKYHGPILAGKIGISIAMWTAGFNIANSWLTAVTPKINILVSEKDWIKLDSVFNRNILLSILTMVIGGVSFFTLWHLVGEEYIIFQRILSIESMCILFACWLFQILINGLALYLRAHKKEPMMPISLFSALYVSITSLLCAMYLRENYLFLGFLSSYIYGLPITYYLYKRQKREHLVDK